jgi:hypothetical protein
MYSFQVDSLKDHGKVTLRKDFSKKQIAQVAKFEKAYTDAVNELAENPDRPATVRGPGGQEQKVSAGQVAGVLRTANVQAIPGWDKGMNFQDGQMNVGRYGLSGEGTLRGIRQGDSDRNLRIEATHEGIHGSGANNMWRGQSSKDFNADHQEPFNRAAVELLDEE